MKIVHYLSILLLSSNLYFIEVQSSNKNVSKSTCGQARAILPRDIPATLDTPGVYCLKCDVTHTGTGAAISVTSDNVTILGNKHRINLTDLTAQGIAATGVENLVIEGVDIRLPDGVRSFEDSSAAIFIDGSSHVLINGANVQRTGYGIFAQNSSDIKALNLFAVDNGLANISSESVTGLVLDRVSFSNTVNDLGFAGFFATGPTRELTVTNSHFHNSDFFLRQVVGVLIENNVIFFDDPNYPFGLVQLGSSAADAEANNIIIRGNTLTTQTDVPVIFVRVNGAIFQDNVVENQSPTGGFRLNLEYSSSAGVNTSDTLIKNNVFTGNAAFSILIGSATHQGITIEGNQMSGATNDAIGLLSGTDVLIQNNHITQSGNRDVAPILPGAGYNGINLISGASNVALLDNIITGCADNGILFQDVTNNLAQGNRTFGNGCAGIFDVNGLNTVTADNIQFNNGAACLPPAAVAKAVQAEGVTRARIK